MPEPQPSFQYCPPTLEELLKYPASAIRKVAGNIARHHWVQMAGAPESVKIGHSLSAHEFGVSVADMKKATTLGRLRRLANENFWLDKLNHLMDLKREQDARTHGLLGEQKVGKMAYCSDSTISVIKAREKAIREGLARSPRNNLADIYAHSAKASFNKSYLLAKAMDVVAKKRGMNWVLITLTCPPPYHASSACFDGLSFTDGQLYLTRQFAQIGREIAKHGFKAGEHYHGMRIVEMHKDGTPHWHILFYYVGTLNNVIEQKLSRIYSKERSRPENYFEVYKDKIFIYPDAEVEIQETRTTTAAVSYLFKNMAHAFQLKENNSNEDAIRHRYALKATRVKQVYPLGVSGVSGKLDALRKAYKNDHLPEKLKNLAAPWKMDKGDVRRKETQLQAMVRVLEGSLDDIQLLPTEKLNKYGEKVERITHIQCKSSLEITCIDGPSTPPPKWGEEWRGGVTINDSSLSDGSGESCLTRLVETHGAPSQDDQGVTITEVNNCQECHRAMALEAPERLLPCNDGSPLVSQADVCHRCPEGSGGILQSLGEAIREQFYLLQRIGHNRLRWLEMLRLVPFLALLALGMPAKSCLAHSDGRLLLSHHLLGIRSESPMHPIPSPSSLGLAGGGRDPPSFVSLPVLKNWS